MKSYKTNKNTPYVAVKNGGWLFVQAKEEYVRMYGFPTMADFEKFNFIGDYQETFLPIHYDQCVSVELIDAFLAAKDETLSLDDLVIDCYDNAGILTEFTLQVPVLKTVREFLQFRNLI